MIVKSAIDHPVTVTVGVILVVLFGIIGLMTIPVQLVPDVERPVITVTTRWIGASPQEVEREIVDEQEDYLKSLDGLVKMTSESKDSEGTITLEFQIGTNLDVAVQKVANKLEQVPKYPDDADKPVIDTTGANANAIAWFILQSHDPNTNVTHLKDLAEDFIKAALERVPGVARSNVFGGLEHEMRVTFDVNALAARGISIQELAQILDRENVNVSAGDFDEGKRRYVVRTVGEFRSAHDIDNVILKSDHNGTVYVRDIAETELTFEKVRSFARSKGDACIAINCEQQAGSNVLVTMEGIKETVVRLNSELLEPRNLTLVQLYDETVYINSSINLVMNNIFVGGLLAILALLIFLRTIRATIIVGLAIPISIIGTFILARILGLTLNVVSLAGIAFAVGMVVDNAVVVLENIYRHVQMGKTPRQAAFDGATEVWGAVLASTLTTIAVFLPVIFVEDQAGQLFRDICIAITCGISLSLVVSVLVIPCAAVRVLSKKRTIKTDEFGTPVDRWASFHSLFGLAPFFQRIVDRVADFTAWMSVSYFVRIATIIGLVSASVILSIILVPDAEYLPTGNQNFVYGIILPPPGYNLEEMSTIGKVVEERMRPLWEMQDDGKKDHLVGLENFFYVAWGRNIFMGSTAQIEHRAHELVGALFGAVMGIPGIIPIFMQSSLFSDDLAGGRTVEIELVGPDLENLVELGGRVFGQVMQFLPDSQARPVPSLDLSSPEIQVIPDRKRMADLGISARQLGFAVNAAVDGAKASDFKYLGKIIDLRVRGAYQVASAQDVAMIPLETPTGQVVTVGSVAHVLSTAGPEQINHSERERTITIQVIPSETMPLEKAIHIIENQILQPLQQEGLLGTDYRARLSGTADRLTTTLQALKWNLILALLITYLLMSSLFENFLYPFVIMFTVPFAAVGGLIGLRLVNLLLAYQAMDILTMLGFVILIGTVVNSAILIVHQTLNFMREEKLDMRSALQQSVRTRTRPVFMTVTTSVAGMLPLVIFPGAGSELYRGLGSVVVGGLVISTLFTLLVIPAMFSLVWDIKEGCKKLLGITTTP